MDFAGFKRLFAPLGVRLFREVPGQDREEDLPELTVDAWQEHLGNGPRLGAYVQGADGRVRFSRIDLDVSPPDMPRSELLGHLDDLKSRASRVRGALLAKGLSDDQILVEFSGVGYHLWLFYEEPVPAALIQRAALSILSRTGLLDTPFKPRFPFERDRDRVWLPLGVNRYQGLRSALVADLESFDPGSYPRGVRDELLASVRLVDPKKLL